MAANPFRDQLPKKAVKSDCPSCGPKHRKTLSHYIDTDARRQPHPPCQLETASEAVVFIPYGSTSQPIAQFPVISK